MKSTYNTPAEQGIRAARKENADLTPMSTMRKVRAAKLQAKREHVRTRRDEHVTAINAKFAELAAIIEKHHMGENPTWSDCGSLDHMLEQLTYLTDGYEGILPVDAGCVESGPKLGWEAING